MSQFYINVDISGCVKNLERTMMNQIPFAMSRALNKTAFDCNAEIKKKLPQIFDRPTPWTINALYVKKSTKRFLVASLEYKGWAPKGTASARIITQHVEGGIRKFKSSERKLQRRGLIPTNSFTIPSSYARINQYGNISPGQINQMLSGLKATGDSATYSQGKKANAWYVSRNKRMIFHRKGKEAVPILYVTRNVNYKKRYNPESIINKTSIRVFPNNFSEAIGHAIKTAK